MIYLMKYAHFFVDRSESVDQTVVQAGALTNSIEACRAVQLPGWNTEEEQNENSFE